MLSSSSSITTLMRGALAILSALLVFVPQISAHDSPALFTPLKKVQPQIVAGSMAYHGGRYEATNLLDGNPRTEYSSASKGKDTFIVFDFGRQVALAGFRHVDRADPATVARSQLTFSNTRDFDQTFTPVDVEHVNDRSGKTTITFPQVLARYVRWQIRELGPARYATVGGAEVDFFEGLAAKTQPTQVKVHLRAVDALLRSETGAQQPLEITIDYPYAETCEGAIQIGDRSPSPLRLSAGSNAVAVPPIPAVTNETDLEVLVSIANHAFRESLRVRPVRQWELCFLPHSHNDIGYTHVQTEVEQKQWQYFEDAIELARKTQDYPEGAQFRWNVEVLWAVDSYLKRAPAAKQEEFVEAVRHGWVGLDALYGNQLTALCSPEELFRLVDFARRLSVDRELPIDSAMISDVPGYTWGIVPALAHSGVKYFSIGPNHIHRIGHTLDAWGDRPFYWISPSGKDRVLCWMAGHAYSWFHPGLLGSIKNVKPESLLGYIDDLSRRGYPYDMVQIRYSVGGDNGPPDPDLPEFIKDWNSRYVWPRLSMATTGDLMREFERRYSDRIPEVRGDFTPYWEDGAASSARETALTRNAAERLVQAETLWAMFRSRDNNVDGFEDAWRNVLLYNEHTWGAHCSISQPDSEFTLSQWAIKQAFAVEADKQSKALLSQATAKVSPSTASVTTAVDVYNTCSWARSDLVALAAKENLAGDRVTTEDGDPVPSQRLASGELVFWAANVPPLAGKRFHLVTGVPSSQGTARARGNTLSTQDLTVSIDEASGAIAQLRWNQAQVDLASHGESGGLNTYHYVAGRDPQQTSSVQSARVRVVDGGPLVATLVVESNAPGCRKLTREVRVVDGASRVDLINTIDKTEIRDAESVHFGFAPHIPRGIMRMEIPWAIIRPEQDQLPGACKNYFTIGRWVDVANENLGITWASVDAPLVEVGGIHVDVPQPLKTEGWIQQLEPTTAFYSYVMNNYWETNYRASQEGPTTFRYSIQPHGPYQPSAATRFGIERSTPLVCVPADPGAPVQKSLFRIVPETVIATSVKQSRDGKALMVRLYNVADTDVRTQIEWGLFRPSRVLESSPAEVAGSVLDQSLRVPARGIVTVRAEM